MTGTGPGGPLVLVGLMGAGKSTVGRRLAELAGLEFVDLDAEIARSAGTDIEEVFAARGEAGFRRLEVAATRALAAFRGAAPRPGAAPVVAVGGGWMANREARAALPDARTVWLKVTPGEAARRLSESDATRPLLTGYEPARRLSELLAERLPAYGEATYTVDTNGRDAGAVARAVAAAVGLTLENQETKREG